MVTSSADSAKLIQLSDTIDLDRLTAIAVGGAGGMLQTQVGEARRQLPCASMVASCMPLVNRKKN